MLASIALRQKLRKLGLSPLTSRFLPAITRWSCPTMGVVRRSERFRLAKTPVKSVPFQRSSAGRRLFHSVFHSCGNLGGETERFACPRSRRSRFNETRDCSIGNSQRPNPDSENLKQAGKSSRSRPCTGSRVGLRFGFSDLFSKIEVSSGPGNRLIASYVSRNRWRDRRRASVLTS